MTDVRRLLERQAEWQKARGSLSWPEKIRMAEAMRETLRQFRDMPSRETRRPLAVSISESTRQGAGHRNGEAK
jgi:hypothetical protein